MRPKNYKTGITNLWWEPAKFLWKTMTLFYHLHVINVMWKLTLNFCTICVQIQIFFDEKSLCYFQRWGSWFSTKPSFYGLKEKLALKLDMTKNQTPIFIHSVIYELQYKTLDIKAWRDRQPKIDLNFRAVGLQEAGSGSIWILSQSRDIFRKKFVRAT